MRTDHPSKLFVEVTTRCNLRCGMCMKQNGDSVIPEGNMSSGTFSALEPAFPYLEALILNGVGEPLLHPQLEDFIRRAKKSLPAGAWVGFQSNGMLLNYERAASLIEAGLDRICLSVDAVSRESFRTIRGGGEMGAMESAFAALNGAREKAGRRFEAGIEFVVRRDNLLQLPAALRWAADRGAVFAVVTQLLPYDRAMVGETAYDTNTSDAVSVYETWRDRAKAEGVDIRRYPEVFMKFSKSGEDMKILRFAGRMKSDARSKGIALHVDRLLRRDDEWLRKVGLVFEEAGQVAAESGIDLRLPGTTPKNNRRCDFVEGKGAFVSWDGNVHPCYFLWHRCDCHIGGWQKQVTPRIFGNLHEKDIPAIWNDREYASFREGVLRYDFPFCFDCGFALCDYVSAADFERDCYLGGVPCGACLWCTGLFQCFQ